MYADVTVYYGTLWPESMQCLCDHGALRHLTTLAFLFACVLSSSLKFALFVTHLGFVFGERDFFGKARPRSDSWSVPVQYERDRGEWDANESEQARAPPVAQVVVHWFSDQRETATE